MEAGGEFFLPQELLVVILLQEVVSGLFDLVEVVGDILELSHKLELILDFIEEITISGVETGHLSGKRDEIFNDLVDDVTDTVKTLIANN